MGCNSITSFETAAAAIHHLSYQVRFLEKHDGRWLFVFASHGDTQLEYYAFPFIRVGADGKIEWMNESAKAALLDHPILVFCAGKLCARTKDQNASLRATITEIAALSPIDIRSSLSAGFGNKAAIPLVLEDGLDDKFHVVWVSWSYGMIVVSFDDHEAIRHRLDLAKVIYGLSQAQSKLAALLIDGKDLGQAAGNLGISLNTARTHLRRMFDKTKVHSQTALVRLILSISSPASWN